MTRLGSSILATDLASLAASGAGVWKELVSIDSNPTPREGVSYIAPRVLHLWSDIGLGGSTPFGFEAQLTLGVGDVSSVRPIVSQVIPLVNVPANGLALPVPAGEVRVAVRLRAGHVVANPNCRVYAQISHGAPVVTLYRGGLQCTDPAGVTISLDPEEFPFAQSLLVTALGVPGTVNYGFAASPVPVGSTLELPFSAKLSLANGPGGQLLYIVKQVF